MHMGSFAKIKPSRKFLNLQYLVCNWRFYLFFFFFGGGGGGGEKDFLLINGRVAQSVTCLATDACLTAIPGVASSIPARSHTFVEIDHEIISTVILLPSADSFKKGCCQL